MKKKKEIEEQIKKHQLESDRLWNIGHYNAANDEDKKKEALEWVIK